MKTRRYWLMAFLGAMAGMTGMSGCGPSGPQSIAKGVVTVNGTPTEDVTLTFYPGTSAVASFTVTSGVGGSFELISGAEDTATEGKFRVTATKYTLKNGSKVKLNPEEGMDIEQLKGTGALLNQLPRQLEKADATSLSVEIKKGMQDLKVEIKAPEAKKK